ncbi:hypothetical protein [Bradyrhizobium sp. SZCCHNRI1003]|uniref:hypothetical protein n=1 Tax=Bradyrhizobium sp. SZCCHNRI1003 TaxID=3057275 RepID=UPI002916830D|nr:hypothetical protein [Bradyrhizobium sp. SZCCHNRI1003]
MSVLREVLRDALHLVIFMDFGGAVVIFILGIKTQFSRMDEYLDRRGSLFSLRRPLPSEFSNEYYASYRRSVWLMAAFLAAVAIGLLLSWLDILIFDPAN